MIGITKALEAELKARGNSDADIARLFGPSAHHGEIRILYDRGNGDLTSALPSSRHMAYVQKNWTAVAIVDDPEQATTEPTEIPRELAAHARNDRVAIWTRGADSLESSCRNAASLISKGRCFAGLADEARRSALSRARPWPPATPRSAEPATEEAAAAEERKRP